MPPVKKNKFKPEKVIPLARFGSVYITINGLAVPATAGSAVSAIATHGLSLVSLGFIAAATATTVRFAKSLDNNVVANYALGNSGSFSNFVYRTFRKSPLRIYTVNHLGRHVEQLLTSADEKAAYRSEYRTPKTKAAEPPPITPSVEASDFSIKHTADYLARISDPRRHIEHIMVAALAVFAGFQLLGDLSSHGHLTLFQIAKRVVGYALDVAYSIGHIDAYIQRRAAENPPRPFFILANKWAKKIPITRLGGNLYIWWDNKNIQTVKSGGQLWHWRAEMAVAKKMPAFIGKHWIERLNRSKMEITPQVIERLQAIGALERLENLEKVANGQRSDPLIEKINIREAYADLVADTELKVVQIGEQYRVYAKQVAQRNQINSKRAKSESQQRIEPSFTRDEWTSPPLRAYPPLKGVRRTFPERRND